MDAVDSDGLLTISGSGEMENWNYFDKNYSPWYSHKSQIKTVKIEDGVTNIGEFAFYGFTELAEVTIPDSVTSIGNCAFYSCKGLTNVTIPNGVTTIGRLAFDDCRSLTSVTIPNSVTIIDDDAFANCYALINITVPDSFTYIGSDVFHNTAYYKEPSNWDNGVLYVGKYLMEANPETIFEEYTIKDGTKRIASYAFHKCTNLKSVIIPGSVTNIGECAFADCSNLASVTINNGVKSINDGAFSNCTALANITIPDSVTYLGSYVLYGTPYYKEPSNWDNGVLYVGKYLMEANPETISEEYTIKDGTKLIANYAFYYCTNLKSVTVPGSVKDISDDAFYSCTGLTNVTIENGVKGIGEDAFIGCTALTEITIPDSVTSIDGGAFYYCNSLTNITIGNGVKNIGAYAFSHCTALAEITIPDSVTSIEEAAFVNCDSLTSIKIPENVTSIGEYAFGYKRDSASEAIVKVSGFTVCGYTGTLAEKYAAENGFDFISMGDHTHTYTAKETTPATCTTDGVMAYTCVCGDSYTKTTVKTGHAEVTDKAVAATCTKAGLTEGKHCSVCGEVTVEQKTVAKKAHTYKTTTTKATLSKNGSTVTKCTVCGYLKSNVAIAKIKSVKLSKTSLTYNGKTQKPTVTVKDSRGKTLKQGTDYTVKYSKGCKNVGQYTVTVTFKGNYSGTKTLTFKIVPKGTSVSKLTAGKKQLTVKWTKQSKQTTGYEIQYSTSSKMKNAKTVTIKKTGTTSTTIKNLKAGKKYYVRVRTFKTVKINGKSVKLYSNWSSVKNIKTK